MTVLKANAHQAEIRTLPRAIALTPPLSPIKPEPDPEPERPDALTLVRAELDVLRAEMAKQDIAIEKLTEGVETAYREGEAAGRTAGLKDAEDNQDARLAALNSGVEQALETFADVLAGQAENLAVRIGREALANILSDVGSYPDLLARIIRKQIVAAGSHSVLAIEVSTDDFPEPAQLDRLAATAGHPGLEVRAVEALTTGQCRIGMRLGALDAGVSQQWERLDALLSDHLAAQAAE